MWHRAGPVTFSEAFFEDLITHIDTKTIDLREENHCLKHQVCQRLRDKASRKTMVDIKDRYRMNEHVKAQAVKAVSYSTDTHNQCRFSLIYGKLALPVKIQNNVKNAQTSMLQNKLQDNNTNNAHTQGDKHVSKHVVLDIPCMTVLYQTDQHTLKMDFISHEDPKHHSQTCWHFMCTSTMTQQGKWKLSSLHSIQLTRKPPHVSTNKTTVQIPHRDMRLLSRSIHLTARQTCSLHESAWNFPMLTSSPLYTAWSSTLNDNNVILFTIMFK